VDVGAWLRGLGLERYERAFREADVGVDVLPDLTDADLRELGVSLGDRKRLLLIFYGYTRRSQRHIPSEGMSGLSMED
jgi:hypothetical protein